MTVRTALVVSLLLLGLLAFGVSIASSEMADRSRRRPRGLSRSEHLICWALIAASYVLAAAVVWIAWQLGQGRWDL